MKLIVGLGNPEKSYENTRHNIGFMVIDGYIKDAMWQEKMKALYCKKTINNEVIYFIKPQTYMNLSGQAVRAYANYFNIETKDILIIQDDLDLNFGDYKLKKKSSSGGHNGIKSIIQELGTDDFLRLKIGIKTPQKRDTIDFVLSKFTKDELNSIQNMQDTYNKIIESFITKGIEKTMNIYNTK